MVLPGEPQESLTNTIRQIRKMGAGGVVWSMVKDKLHGTYVIYSSQEVIVQFHSKPPWLSCGVIA